MIASSTGGARVFYILPLTEYNVSIMAARVLLIEDNLFIREIYKDFMTGYELTVAVDGQEGIDKIKEGGWDLVLVDENLPKLKGVDVLRQAREINPAPFKKIVFLTNEQLPENKEDDRLKLSDAYLVKSEFSPEDLIEKLKEYLPS